MSRAQSKFSKDDFSLALRMSAEGFTPTQIIKHFKDSNLPHPHIRNLYKILSAKKNQAEIEVYKQAYYAKIKDVPVAHKRIRLDFIQTTLNVIKKSFDNMVDTKGTIKARNFKKCVQLIKRLDEMLTRAQDEMEKRPGMVVALTQHFSDRELSDEELLVEERNLDKRLGKLRQKGISVSDKEETGPTEV